MRLQSLRILAMAILALTAANPASAAKKNPEQRLDECLQKMENWMGLSLNFHRQARVPEVEFMKELAQKLENKPVHDFDSDLLELRDEVSVIHGTQNKLDYCQNKLEAAKNMSATWIEDIRVSQQKGEKVPPAVIQHFEEMGEALTSSEAK